MVYAPAPCAVALGMVFGDVPTGEESQVSHASSEMLPTEAEGHSVLSGKHLLLFSFA